MPEDKGASWVGDVRKLLQDFVAPELRAIATRLDEADRHDAKRDKVAAKRHLALLDKLESNRREIMLQVDLMLATRKIEELQARQAAAPQ